MDALWLPASLITLSMSVPCKGLCLRFIFQRHCHSLTTTVILTNSSLVCQISSGRSLLIFVYAKLLHSFVCWTIPRSPSTSHSLIYHTHILFGFPRNKENRKYKKKTQYTRYELAFLSFTTTVFWRTVFVSPYFPIYRYGICVRFFTLLYNCVADTEKGRSACGGMVHVPRAMFPLT